MDKEELKVMKEYVEYIKEKDRKEELAKQRKIAKQNEEARFNFLIFFMILLILSIPGFAMWADIFKEISQSAP